MVPLGILQWNTLDYQGNYIQEKHPFPLRRRGASQQRSAYKTCKFIRVMVCLLLLLRLQREQNIYAAEKIGSLCQDKFEFFCKQQQQQQPCWTRSSVVQFEFKFITEKTHKQNARLN